MKPLPSVYVALPTHNRRDSLGRFLRSLREQDYAHIQVVVCDDGSTDGTGEMLRDEFPEVAVVQGTGSLWWTGGMNRCVEYILTRAGDGDYVLTINDDVILPPHYISQKVDRAREFPGAIIGSVCVYMEDEDKIETSGMMVDFRARKFCPLVPHGARRSRLNVSGMVPASHLPGKGVLIPVSVYKRIGLYDGKHFPHYHADSEFTFRAFKYGIKVYVDFDSVVRSQVNLYNAGRSSSRPSFRQVLHSFFSPYGLNSFQAYWNMACLHFPEAKWDFLLRSYARITGGMLKRALFANKK
ncbi:MAG: glycosyltransferase family 2 protein [Gammaproteobacteria bacterium]|nr:MAG: glycosyltransferase family 2 protein [Gammaproteobacteria bacterium]